MFTIEKLEDLIKDYLGDNREFIDYTAINLNEPGENYGSLMLSLDIKVKNKKTNEEETIRAVAKTPPTDEFAQKIFNTQVTFKNEIGFYSVIFPFMQKFQKEHSIEPSTYFPDYIGSRLNLHGGDKVETSAVLILENLTEKGFTMGNRFNGFNLNTVKLILKDLANFHATMIAIKLQKPNEFETLVKPYLDGVVFEGENADDNFIQSVCKDSTEMLKNHKDIVHLTDKLIQKVKSQGRREVREPFATVVHTDLWVNNTMLRFNDDQPVENKFIDFQVTRYQTPADDLLFLLFSSVEDEVLTQHYDNLIKYYHQQFITILDALKVDTSKFSWEAFQEEINHSVDAQIGHVTCMLFPILMDKSKAKEFEFEKERPFEPSERHMEKLPLLVRLFDKHGWLN